jgi:hypothetical protein
MWREGVSLKAKRANPKTSAHVYLATILLVSEAKDAATGVIPEWVEHSTTWCLAGHRFILEQWCIGLLFEWGVEGANGDYKYNISIWKAYACFGTTHQPAVMLPYDSRGKHSNSV